MLSREVSHDVRLGNYFLFFAAACELNPHFQWVYVNLMSQAKSKKSFSAPIPSETTPVPVLRDGKFVPFQRLFSPH